MDKLQDNLCLDVSLFENFEAASRGVLEFLHQRLGFGLWMMTRTVGPDWVILQAEDHKYGVSEGDVLRWADSFCSRMVIGLGPRVAPRADEVPAYRDAPIARQIEIGAYMGVPVTCVNGSLFGTLCAIDPNPVDESVVAELPLVQLFAQLLGTILASDLAALERARKLELTEQLAMTDELTGLLNRRGWNRSVESEEERARRYGTPIAAIAIDLDGLKKINDTEGHQAGDELIRRAGMCIRRSIRENDIAARIGGDEFGVLAMECDAEGAAAIREKLLDSLTAADVSASVGVSVRDPRKGLAKAVSDADREMYLAKAERRRKSEYSAITFGELNSKRHFPDSRLNGAN